MVKGHRRLEVEAQANSVLLNLDQGFHLRCLSMGVAVPGLQVDAEGYTRVGYYVAGMRSAWVQQAKMRRAWPQLETKVVNVADQPCEWSAEIWAKRKDAAS